MKRIAMILASLCFVATMIGCSGEKDNDASIRMDSVGSKIQQGAEKIGEALDTAATSVKTQVDESKIEGMLHNIRGLENVDVDLTSGGDVTLIGSAPNDERRMEAERIVRQINGVNTVINAVKVGSGGTARDTMVLGDTSRAKRR